MTTSEKFKAKRGRPRRYAWDAWTSGGTFVVRRGEDADFIVTPRIFVNYLHAKAASIGKRATASIDPDTEEVTFRFYVPKGASK